MIFDHLHFRMESRWGQVTVNAMFFFVLIGTSIDIHHFSGVVSPIIDLDFKAWTKNSPVMGHEGSFYIAYDGWNGNFHEILRGEVSSSCGELTKLVTARMWGSSLPYYGFLSQYYFLLPFIFSLPPHGTCSHKLFPFPSEYK